MNDDEKVTKEDLKKAMDAEVAAGRLVECGGRYRRPVTDQFLRRDITRPHPVNGIEAHMAVWNHDGLHIAIGCASLKILEEAWLKLTGSELAFPPMHVEIIPFDPRLDNSQSADEVA